MIFFSAHSSRLSWSLSLVMVVGGEMKWEKIAETEQHLGFIIQGVELRVKYVHSFSKQTHQSCRIIQS